MGRPKKPGIKLVEQSEMEPFLQDIREILENLHLSIRMYEIELIQQGYTEDQAAEKARQECYRIKRQIV